MDLLGFNLNQLSLLALALVAGVAVLLLVAAIIIFFIFQIAQLYLGPIYDTLETL